jgi:hypothetical protein
MTAGKNTALGLVTLLTLSSVLATFLTMNIRQVQIFF